MIPHEPGVPVIFVGLCSRRPVVVMLRGGGEEMLHQVRERLRFERFSQSGDAPFEFGAVAGVSPDMPEVGGHDCSALDIHAGGILGDRVPRVQPVVEQCLREQSQRFPAREQAKREIKVVRVTERREVTHLAENRAPDDIVGCGHQEVGVGEGQRQITRLIQYGERLPVPRVGDLLAILADEAHVGGHGRSAGVRDHRRSARLQSSRCVDVVGIQDRDEFPGRTVDRGIEGLVGALVRLRPEHDFRVSLAEPAHDFRGVVGGAVVDDDDFGGRQRLAEDTGYCLTDEFAMVVQRYHHRDLHRGEVDDRQGGMHDEGMFFRGGLISFHLCPPIERCRRLGPVTLVAGIELAKHRPEAPEAPPDRGPLHGRCVGGRFVTFPGKALQQFEGVRDDPRHPGVRSQCARLEGAVSQVEGHDAVGVLRHAGAYPAIERYAKRACYPLQFTSGCMQKAIVINHDSRRSRGVIHRSEHVAHPQQVGLFGCKTIPCSERSSHAQRVSQGDHIARNRAGPFDQRLPERQQARGARILDRPYAVLVEALLQEFQRLVGQALKLRLFPFVRRDGFDAVPGPAEGKEHAIVSGDNVEILPEALGVLVRHGLHQSLAKTGAQSSNPAGEGAGAAPMHAEDQDHSSSGIPRFWAHCESLDKTQRKTVPVRAPLCEDGQCRAGKRAGSKAWQPTPDLPSIRPFTAGKFPAADMTCATATLPHANRLPAAPCLLPELLLLP